MTSRFVFISAWNDSGGGFLHRLFDGHPETRCYPYEVQLGTGLFPDRLAEWFHPKYRWPVLSAGMSADEIFDAIINDELWDAVRHSPSSKFRDFPLKLDVDGWRRSFADRAGSSTAVGEIVRTYLDTFFEAWSDRQYPAGQEIILGHCPVMALDWDRIVCDAPTSQMLHVVRSPFAGFVDMRRRHPTLDPESYGRKWALVNSLAFAAAAKDPTRFRLVTLDRLIDDRAETTRQLSEWIGIGYRESLLYPSWNGRPLTEQGPFGGVPKIGREHEAANLAALEPETLNVLATTTAGARGLFDIAAP
jgi:hypothetical protein